MCLVRCYFPSDTLLKNPLADYRMSRHKAQKQEKFTKLDPESPHSLFMRMKHNDRVAKFVEFRIDTFIEQGGEDQIDFPRALFNDDRHEYYRIARNRRSRTYAKCQAKERRLMRRLWYRIRMAFHCVEANTLSYIDGVFMDDKFLDFELLGERLWNWFAILFRETRWFFTWKFTDVICEQEEWEDSESERWDDLSDAVIRFLRSQFKDSFEPDHDWNLGGAD